MTDETTELDRHTTWQLARLAECADPDVPVMSSFPHPEPQERPPSAGARFLHSVEDGAAEAVEQLRDGGDLDDLSHEIADGAPDVYNHTRWQEFTDLAAWQEDIEELASTDDMTAAAGVALYQIANRLVLSLWEDWGVIDEYGALVEPDEDDEDETDG